MKKVQSILFTAVLAVTLVACGGDGKKNDKDGDTTATATPAPVEEVPVEEPVQDTTAVVTDGTVETPAAEVTTK
jgi:hypothetical protein